MQVWHATRMHHPIRRGVGRPAAPCMVAARMEVSSLTARLSAVCLSSQPSPIPLEASPDAPSTAVPSEANASEVLASADLLPSVFLTLRLAEWQAAAVCKAWSRAWSTMLHARGHLLRMAACPSPADFEYHGRGGLAVVAAQGAGEWLTVTDWDGQRPVVRVLDKEMRLLFTLSDPNLNVDFDDSFRLAASPECGLLVSEHKPPRLRRIDAHSRTMPISRTSDEHEGFYDLTVAPGGVVFVQAVRKDTRLEELLAIDAVTLDTRFTVSEAAWGGGAIGGLSVCATAAELYVGSRTGRCIHVLSLSGAPRRVIHWAADGGTAGPAPPRALSCADGKLMLIEEDEPSLSPVRRQRASREGDEERTTTAAGRRILVLSPTDGTTLQIVGPRRPADCTTPTRQWRAMCQWGNRLLVATSWADVPERPYSLYDETDAAQADEGAWELIALAGTYDTLTHGRHRLFVP